MNKKQYLTPVAVRLALHLEGPVIAASLKTGSDSEDVDTSDKSRGRSADASPIWDALDA